MFFYGERSKMGGEWSSDTTQPQISTVHPQKKTFLNIIMLEYKRMVDYLEAAVVILFFISGRKQYEEYNYEVYL